MLIPDKSILNWSCDKKQCMCSHRIMISCECHHIFSNTQCYAQLKSANPNKPKFSCDEKQCMCSRRMMPHVSAITNSTRNVVCNWKQLFPTNQNLAATRRSSVNALVVWCLMWVPSQIQYTMSCSIEISYLQNQPKSSYDKKHCLCSRRMMPHVSTITNSTRNIMRNWKQLFPTNQNLAATRRSSVNALVVWCLMWVPSQIQYTMSCSIEISYLLNKPKSSYHEKHCQCSRRMMPHVSTITISTRNVVRNWKQLFPTNPNLAATRRSSVCALVLFWCLSWVPSQSQQHLFYPTNQFQRNKL